MKIIYKKSDLMCVGTVLDGLTVEKMIKLNVIPNFGGQISDYDSIQTDKDNIHLENINGVVAVVESHTTTPTPQPTQQETINAKLLKDNADMQIQLQSQQKINADLMLKVAQLGGSANV